MYTLCCWLSKWSWSIKSDPQNQLIKIDKYIIHHHIETNSLDCWKKTAMSRPFYRLYYILSLTLLSHDEDVLFWGADWLMMIGLSLESANDNFFYKCKVQKGH